MTGVFTLFLAYSSRDPRFSSLHWKASAPASTLRERSPTIGCLRSQSVASAGGLSPDHYRRGHAGLVSYYALFKGWLLLSQPPSCHSMSTSLDTLSRHSGALADGLGSFPLASGHYRPPTVSLAASDRHSEFGWGRYGLRHPNPSSALPPADSIPEAIPKYVSERTSYPRA